VREHDDDQHHRHYHCLDDRPRYRQTLCRQRRREKDQAELEDQQDRQARISDPVLPGMNDVRLLSKTAEWR